MLRDRARSELEALALTNAQTVAALLDRGRLAPDPAATRTLARDANRYAADVGGGGRVVVLDAKGIVIADSSGLDLGQNFITTGRPEVAQAFRSLATALTRFSQDEGGDIVVAAAPIIDEGSLVGVVRISRGVAQVQARRHARDRGHPGRRARRPGRRARDRLRAGRFACATPVPAGAGRAAPGRRRPLVARGRRRGNGGAHRAAGSFDEMADRLERTVRAQREFVANASHQLRTPLTGIKLRLEAAANAGPDDNLHAQLQAADVEVDRLATIIDRLLLLARRVEEGQASESDLGHAVERAVDRWRDRARAAGSTLTWTGTGGTAVADPGDLDQLLDALIDNALTHGGGSVQIEAGPQGDALVLAVQDGGTGIAAGERSRVTERFYRGRDAPSGGSGLGLAIARELAEASGGTLRVQEAPGGGTRIEVLLTRGGTAPPSSRDAGP